MLCLADAEIRTGAAASQRGSCQPSLLSLKCRSESWDSRAKLAEILGAKKVWAYIKKHKLQDPNKRREIVADDKLKQVFGKARLDMFQMTKAISKHLSK